MTKASPRMIGSIVATAAIAAAIAVAAIVWRPAMAAIEPPAPQSFDSALVRRGRYLAAIGNCNDCHTVRDGRDFAGGLAVPTPFGTVYSSNITPDAETGIGRWSEAAFRRAMQSGVDRDGQHLYPTFPYDHFTHVSDDDDRALYAYLMTRPAVRAPARDNQLSFPFNQRVVVAGWKLLFLRQGSYQADATKTAEWNRGGYLVEGLAHCGACHTPRNALGAEKARDAFGGGDVENWHAYAINRQSPAPVPWDADALFRYLRQGWDPDHGVARGPMAQVVGNLSGVPESDVRAIATYMADKFGAPTPERKRRADDVLAQAAARPPQAAQASSGTAGASLYAAACATCHDSERAPPFGGINLALSTTINGPDARNAANIILAGIRPVAGERSAIMPGFADSMSDDQITALLDYLRARFSQQPPWTNTANIVRESRRTQTALLQTSSAPGNAAVDATRRDKP
jgi:mono/diheme cytochrome c family protein